MADESLTHVDNGKVESIDQVPIMDFVWVLVALFAIIVLILLACTAALCFVYWEAQRRVDRQKQTETDRQWRQHEQRRLDEHHFELKALERARAVEPKQPTEVIVHTQQAQETPTCPVKSPHPAKDHRCPQPIIVPPVFAQFPFAAPPQTQIASAPVQKTTKPNLETSPKPASAVVINQTIHSPIRSSGPSYALTEKTRTRSTASQTDLSSTATQSASSTSVQPKSVTSAAAVNTDSSVSSNETPQLSDVPVTRLPPKELPSGRRPSPKQATTRRTPPKTVSSETSVELRSSPAHERKILEVDADEMADGIDFMARHATRVDPNFPPNPHVMLDLRKKSIVSATDESQSSSVGMHSPGSPASSCSKSSLGSNEPQNTSESEQQEPLTNNTSELEGTSQISASEASPSYVVDTNTSEREPMEPENHADIRVGVLGVPPTMGPLVSENPYWRSISQQNMDVTRTHSPASGRLRQIHVRSVTSTVWQPPSDYVESPEVSSSKALAIPDARTNKLQLRPQSSSASTARVAPQSSDEVYTPPQRGASPHRNRSYPSNPFRSEELPKKYRAEVVDLKTDSTQRSPMQ